MTEDKGNIEELLQSNLQGRKVAAPDFVWDNVEKAISEKGKKRGFFWLWGSGVMLLLGITAYTIFFTDLWNKRQDIPCYYADYNRDGVDYLFDKYAAFSVDLESRIDGGNQLATSAADEQDNRADSYLHEVSEELGLKQDEVENGFGVSLTDEQSQMNDKAISSQKVKDEISENQFALSDKTADENDIIPIETNQLSNERFESKIDSESGENEISDEIVNGVNPDLTEESTENNSNEDEVLIVTEKQESKSVDEIYSEVVVENKEVLDSVLFIAVSDSIETAEKQLIVENKTKYSVAPSMDEVSIDSTVIALPEEKNTGTLPAEKDIKTSKWEVGLLAGYSAFDMALFKEKFRSGVLSNRTFESRGFDAALHVNYTLVNRFNLGVALNFNQKNTLFNYSVLTDDQGYFEHIIKGNPLPLSEIDDLDESCNCYLIEDVKADYTVSTFFLDLQARYTFVQRKKLTAGVSLFLGTDLNKALRLNEVTILAVENESTQFSVLKTGLGLNVNYWFGDHFGLSIAPKYQFVFPSKNHTFYQQRINEFILHFGMKYRF